MSIHEKEVSFETANLAQVRKPGPVEFRRRCERIKQRLARGRGASRSRPPATLPERKTGQARVPPQRAASTELADMESPAATGSLTEPVAASHGAGDVHRLLRLLLLLPLVDGGQVEVLAGDAADGQVRVIVLAQPAEGEGVDRTNVDGARKDIAQGHWDEVLDEAVQDGHVGPSHHAEGNHEHVCGDVLEADGDEAGDREPDAHHLAGHVLRLSREEDVHADEPVAADALDERREEVLLDLLLGNLDGELHREAHVHVTVGDHRCEDQTTDQVPAPRDGEGPGDLNPRELLLEDRGRHSRGGARDEATSREEDDQAGHRDERREDKGLDLGVVLGTYVYVYIYIYIYM